MSEFEKELTDLINKYSRENASNTPDYILAQYILSCLLAFETATQQRETLYGRNAAPFSTTAPTPTGETPETDDELGMIEAGIALTGDSIKVGYPAGRLRKIINFARKLERERNAALAKLKDQS